VLQLSGNRKEEKDRARAEHDYAVNERALRILERLAEHDLDRKLPDADALLSALAMELAHHHDRVLADVERMIGGTK
jgi:uncharacterized membrane protein